MKTIWFTGLSRSGMTTLGESLACHLRERGHAVEVLDGKLVRDELAGYFGYSRAERIKVGRVLCLMARVLARNGVVPIVTAITPYQESREFNRRELDSYLEVFVDCPVEVCQRRDASGLYDKAIRGDLKHFVGVDDPFEIPKNPDLRLYTAKETPEESAAALQAFVDSKFAE